eukprot:CAMPEP_0172318264 /NCGR_PEP_ID=MMETSP1058-20130122/34352_1 /TAXON_ID=83371 /ORGANISM="Detonula confervacea, Strain CCMP 353" /LENGTH=1097 /DNA_ID=CAMNT_0013033049 /DNA_START=122 /DNA_END=3415 /DNA_ORIENTATION=+
MAPFSFHEQSYESLNKVTTMMHNPQNKNNNNDAGSIGSNTFRSQRRRAYEGQCETDEQLFNQHNIHSIYDNRHHDITVDDDMHSAGSSLGDYSDMSSKQSKGGSVRTRDELRMSLIARRRRLALMESAMGDDGSIDFSLKLNRRNNGDAASLVSTLRDSVLSLNDSLQGSLLSRKPKKKSKDKKKKSKKKTSSGKDKEREKRREKERKEKKKSSKHKRKEKEKHHKSKKSEKKHHGDDDDADNRKMKKKKAREGSDGSSSSSESDRNDEYSRYSKQSRRPPQNNAINNGQGGERDRRQQRISRPITNNDHAAEQSRGNNKERARSIMQKGGKSMRKLLSTQEDGPGANYPSSYPMDSRQQPNTAGVVYYACNETTGMCAFHPGVQLRKKSRFGGWKNVLKSCPKCAAQATQQGPPTTARKSNRSGNIDRSGNMDRSNRSGIDRSGNIDRSNRSARRGRVPREGERKRQSDRGMPHPGPSSRAASSQRQPDNRPRKVEPVPPQQQRAVHRRGDPQQPSRRENAGRRPAADPRNSTSQAPRRMSQSQRGASTPPQRGASPTTRGHSHSVKSGVNNRHAQQPKEARQQSSRHESYWDPPGSSRDPIQSTTRKIGRDRPSQSYSYVQQPRLNPTPKQPPKGHNYAHPSSSARDPNLVRSSHVEERRGGRESTASMGSHSKSIPTQNRMSGMVDFDPPHPSMESRERPKMSQAEALLRFSIGGIDEAPLPRPEEFSSTSMNYDKHRTQETNDDSSHAIGSESDFALFQGRGGKPYNEEGMFNFFKEEMQKRSSAVYEEEKMMNSEQRLMRESSMVAEQTSHVAQARVNSYDHDSYDDVSGIQKMQSKTFHGMPTSASTMPTPAELQRRKSFTSNLQGMGISADALMDFVFAESAHLDKSPENLGKLERALMAQVARLSIGSGEGDVPEGDIEDSKFSVLREVVKSYMSGEIAKNCNSTVNKNNGLSGKDSGRKVDSSPNRERHNYNLGDEGRRRDMIKDDDQDVALMRIASLQPDDPAFIRRTTGKWTFAKVKNVASDSIVFIVNSNASSKAYNVKYWISHIRTLKAPAHNSFDGSDTSGRRGSFAKQMTATRFSVKNLRPD